MLKAYWYRDVRTVVNSPRKILWNFIGVTVLILLMRVSAAGSSAALLGSDFVRLVLLSLIGIVSFMDVYSDSIAKDKRSGVLAYTILSGGSPVAYSLVKILVPLIVSVTCTAVGGLGYMFFVSKISVDLRSFTRLCAFVMLAVAVSMALVFLLNASSDIDVRASPLGMLLPMGINLPIIYLASPFQRFGRYCLISAVIALILWGAGVLFLRGRFSNNLFEASP
ncbi:hypothetical protein [uncultured Propionibacterium sp.]|uniref:hypothetical protein n=1 Tax=uncultured Propionibacterium sp. TaxID=218066 RepID=UPI00292DFEC8|nr:hypothetical protein [uncultured Propionibacterium sp.]